MYIVVVELLHEYFVLLLSPSVRCARSGCLPEQASAGRRKRLKREEKEEPLIDGISSSMKAARTVAEKKPALLADLTAWWWSVTS